MPKRKFEDAKQILFDALKPLGNQYITDLNKAFEERWIDVFPNIGKKDESIEVNDTEKKKRKKRNYKNKSNKTFKK